MEKVPREDLFPSPFCCIAHARAQPAVSDGLDLAFYLFLCGLQAKNGFHVF